MIELIYSVTLRAERIYEWRKFSRKNQKPFLGGINSDKMNLERLMLITIQFIKMDQNRLSILTSRKIQLIRQTVNIIREMASARKANGLVLMDTNQKSRSNIIYTVLIGSFFK